MSPAVRPLRSVTTVCAVSRGIAPYDSERVHLSKLGLDEVRAETDRYFRLSVAEKRALTGMEPKRADVIAAGALILERAMVRLGAREAVDGGVAVGGVSARLLDVSIVPAAGGSTRVGGDGRGRVRTGGRRGMWRAQALRPYLPIGAVEGGDGRGGEGEAVVFEDEAAFAAQRSPFLLY